VEALLARALRAMARGPFTPQTLARALGIGVREAEALIGALLAHGYLREVEPSVCASCPLSSVCRPPQSEDTRVYELTERGLRLIARASP